MGVILGVAAVLSVGAITGAGRAAWEYKVVEGGTSLNSPVKLEKSINDAVSQGWELVSVHGGAPYAFAVLRREPPENAWKAIQGK